MSTLSCPLGRHILIRNSVFLLLFATLALSCAPASLPPPAPGFDLQGHRGARGLLPENSIPAFLEAVRLGVPTIELDVVVSADSQIVVSHEPWMSETICSHPDGSPVTRDEREALNLFRMKYEQIAGFDCGSRGHPGFPDQQPRRTIKPLLSTVFDTVASFSKGIDASPRWNIETKSRPEGDHASQPAPETFVDLLVALIGAHHMEDRVVIQSFDVRTLQALHRRGSGLPLALLVGGDTSPEEALDDLGFVPEILSPNSSHVDSDFVEWAHAQGMQVIPWTVNDVEEMQRIVHTGIDGLITDYPNRFIDAFDWPTPSLR